MKSFLLICLLCLPHASFAVDGECIGVSFSDDASIMVCGEFPLFETWSLYLLLHNPDAEALSGWEAALPVGDGLIQTGVQLEGDAVNRGKDQEYIVDFGTPLPCSSRTRLARFDFITLEPLLYCFQLQGVAEPSISGDLPVIRTADGAMRQVEVLGIWNSGIVQYGGPCGLPPGQQYECIELLPMESRTWGALKSLYR